jgi:tetratricopeptide (TPR) repeat protein/KaiC/GvpD/RAD55 family RecA-like ATPase
LTSLERDRVPSPRPIAAKEIPLVNRVEEMNVLKEAVYRAVHGEGGLVFVHGEAGIGKTRLVRELGAYARSRGVQVLYGRCPALFRMDGVPPYIIWKEIIKDYLETCTPEQLYSVVGNYPSEVAKLVPELGQKLRVIPQSFPISPEQEQNRLFEAVSQLIGNISREAPLLVILDDLQWTDPSSLLLLHYIAHGVQKTSLLLLGAYRSTDIDSKHPLTPVLTELKRERLPQTVSLKRMSLEDISEIIRQILEQDDVPTEFCRLVYEKTRGNPFFTEEVLESLKEEEVIYREGSRWKIKDVSRIEFPETVKNVLKTRFSRLDDECQNVLTLASFVGNDFTLETISALTGIEENKLLELMDRMLKTGLIKEREVRGEGICSFADILVRDVVYEEVSLLKRKKLHGVVGCALEKVYVKKIDEHLGELASHFLESGDKEKALDYFLKAGEKAQKVYANAEAASYFQSALKLLEEKEGETREKGRVLETLGDIKRLVGEYELCMKRWNEAMLLWKQLDEKDKVAALHRKMAVTLWRNIGNTEQARENLEEALKILEAEPESVELAALYAAGAHMSFFTEDVTKARSWTEKALEVAKKLKASEAIASSYITLGSVFDVAGEKEKGLECIEKALKIALDNDYVDVALRAYNNLGNNLPAEEYERSLDCFEKGSELAKKAGDLHYIPWFGMRSAWMHWGMGNSDKALTLAEQSESLDRKTGNLFNLSNSTGCLGLFYHYLGEWSKGEQYLEKSLSISKKINNTQSIMNSYRWLGWSYYDKGEYAKAKEFFDGMAEIIEKQGAKTYEMYFCQWLAMNDIELGEIDKAKTLLDDVHKFAREKQDKQLIANEDATRAKLFCAEKKWTESIELYEKSLQENEALGARKWNVHWLAKTILCEYARVYLERNQPGDKEKARDLLNQALEIFQKMGAKKDIEKVEAKLLYIETGKATSVPKPAELVATGYADLDKLLCGGLRSSSAVILSSPSCNQRDLLIKSFLKTGAEKNEVTFFVTIDPSSGKALAEEFPLNFHLFVCNPQADAIVKEAPNIFKLKSVENLTDISITLTSAIRKLDPTLESPRRICIGLISDILLQHHAVQTRKWLTALTAELKSNEFTTLAVVDPRMHPSEELYAILGLFEGEISIYEKETEKGIGKFLKINRMSNQEYLDDELLLKKEKL